MAPKSRLVAAADGYALDERGARRWIRKGYELPPGWTLVEDDKLTKPKPQPRRVRARPED